EVLGRDLDVLLLEAEEALGGRAVLAARPLAVVEVAFHAQARLALVEAEEPHDLELVRLRAGPRVVPELGAVAQAVLPDRPREDQAEVTRGIDGVEVGGGL